MTAMKTNGMTAPLFLSLVILPAGCADDSMRQQEEPSITSAPGESTPSDPETPIAPLPASVLVLVKDAAGNPLEDAIVIAKTLKPEPYDPDAPQPMDDKPRTWAPALTNSEGIAFFEGIGAGFFTFEVRLDGYSSAVGQAHLEVDSALSYEVRLQPTERWAFHANDGLAVRHPSVTLDIPPDSLVYASGGRYEDDPMNPGQQIYRDLTGQPVTGEIEAELSVVHPVGLDPASLHAPLIGTRADGSPDTMLISAGMLEFRMRQEDLPIQPAPSRPIAINMKVKDLDPVVAQLLAEGKSIPKWYLDVETGRWVEEGIWTPIVDADGDQALSADQTHFTWLNADIPGDPKCHLLHVYNADGTVKKNEKAKILEPPAHEVSLGTGQYFCTESPNPVTVKVCDQTQTVVLKPDPYQEIAACSESGAIVIPDFPGPFDDSLCKEHEIFCKDPKEQICTPNEWKYCDPVADQNIPEIGVCHKSITYCDGGTKWTQCSSAKGPGDELCGVNNELVALDENCNGEVNEGCAMCDGNEIQGCYPGEMKDLKYPNTSCTAGKQQCNGGLWGTCTMPVPVTPLAYEDCSTPKDDNCDGITACDGPIGWATRLPALDANLHTVAPLRPVALTSALAADDVIVGGSVGLVGLQQITNPCAGDKWNLNGVDGFLARIDGTGKCSWASPILGPAEVTVTDVAAFREPGDLNQNNIPNEYEYYVIGHFKNGIIDAVDACPSIANMELDTPHLFFTKYSGNGKCLARIKLTKGTGKVSDSRMAVQATGDVLVAATFKGQIYHTLDVQYPNMIQWSTQIVSDSVQNVYNSDSLLLQLAQPIFTDGFGTAKQGTTIGSASKIGEQVPRDIGIDPMQQSAVVAGYFTEKLGDHDTIPGPTRNGFIGKYTLNQLNGVPTTLDWPVSDNTELASVAMTQSGGIIVGGYSESNELGIFNCAVHEKDTSWHKYTGFVAYDVKKTGNEVMASSCAILYGPGDERVTDIAVISSNNTTTDVLVSAWTVADPNLDALPVRVAMQRDGQPIDLAENCTLEGATTKGVGGAMDGILMRLSFGPAKAECKWAKRMPMNETEKHSTDKFQWPTRVATSPLGGLITTGHYIGGILLGGTNGQMSVKLTGSPSHQEGFVARFSP